MTIQIKVIFLMHKVHKIEAYQQQKKYAQIEMKYFIDIKSFCIFLKVTLVFFSQNFY